MLSLAVSNLAWSPDLTERAYSLLSDHGVGALEIAPGLLFPGEPDSFVPNETAIEAALSLARSYGLELVSMQSLLFGVEGAALFGDAASREVFSHGIARAIGLANRLGIPNLVLGSPRCRVIPPEIPHGEAWRQAREVLLPLADLAADHACMIAMEPNPAQYGTNFINSVPEAIEFCDFVAHPAMTLNFDVGATLLRGENPEDLGALFRRARKHVSHIHLSAPHLAPVSGAEIELATIMRALHEHEAKRYVSIEMLAPSEHPLDALRRAVVDCLEAIDGVPDE